MGGQVRLLRAGERRFQKYLREIERRGEPVDLRLEQKVRSIISEVRQRGDRALLHYTSVFDRIKVSPRQLRVQRAEVDKAYKGISPEFLGTLRRAEQRIRKFHALLSSRFDASPGMKVQRERGIRLAQVTRPLERVGIYVPGGKASYPSTVLMAAIPARVAGVREILMVTPPQEGGISPAVLVAADLAGVDRIYRVGGVQAIAALAFGTESISKVDKIVGPGNRYVATAKRLVYGAVDIDMVAGPSEIVVISDGTTPPSWVAADLISQAEHDEMALAILITPSERFGRRVLEGLRQQLSSLKRKRIAQTSLSRRGAVLIVRNLGQAIEVANQIAPEHLELSLVNPSPFVRKLKHAGAIFLGPHTPEAIGDYLAGPNHILPTAGTARFFSPLGVEDFVKRTNVLGFTRSALKRFADDVKRFTEWEGLEGHDRAVQARERNR